MLALHYLARREAESRVCRDRVVLWELSGRGLRMTVPDTETLIVAISSRALFDPDESHRVFDFVDRLEASPAWVNGARAGAGFVELCERCWRRGRLSRAPVQLKP